MLATLLVALAAAGSSADIGHAQTAARPAASDASLAGLRRAFETPPDDARIMMRWWWFGPAVTRTGIARELQTMKAGGIGGVEIQPVYPLALDDAATGIETHPFLSDAFIEDMRFAAQTARGLGLRVDLTLGSGWPFGGPQVKIADAAGKLRVERVIVQPGSSRAPVPDIRAGEQLIAAFLSPRAPADRAEDVREVGDISDGVLRLDGPSTERREVLFFISSRTGMMVKRPAVGAEGYVLNHYDRAAVGRYLDAVGGRLLTAFGQEPPHAIFCDSLEVYDSDWTVDLLDEFRARRGYDLRPLLPSLVIEGTASAGLRHDWSLTLTELVRDRFLVPVQEWATARGTRFRVQGYGVPPAIVSSNAAVDLPDGEGSQWKTIRASRWAASIGHLYDRPVISSETWTWLHSPVFRATPLDVKAEADLHFLQGINQLIGHGWPYTAEGVAYPGWRFYAAGVFNDRNPWWIVMPDLSRYLQRMSFLLRQGRPVNDVAIYLPTSDTWANFVPGKVGSMIETMNQRVGPALLPAVLAAGFNVDFVDDGVLADRARLDQGAIAIGANRYRAIVLPDITRMPPATMRALEAYAAGGVRVIATKRTPALAPGHAASASDHAEVAGAAARLFGGPGAAGVLVERESDLGAALTARLQPDAAFRLQPDAAFSTAAADLGVVHRRTPDADIYFVANTSNQPVATAATFRVAATRAEAWDPMTGRSAAIPLRRAPVDVHTSPVVGAGSSSVVGAGFSRLQRGPAPFANAGVGATVNLELAPYESTVIVFPVASAPAPRAEAESQTDRSRLPSASLGAGKPAPTIDQRSTVDQPAAIDISAGWRVRIGTDAAAETWDALRSWTDHERTRYFSGVATYEKQLDVPASMLKPGLAVLLDFGAPKPLPVGGPNARVQAWLEAPVREAVVVTVNSTRAGSVWSPPYALDVTAWLRPGANTLRLEVANLAINHMAGRALPDYKLLNLRYGTRFDPQDMDQVQPVPAGLLGSIRLVATPAGSTARSRR